MQTNLVTNKQWIKHHNQTKKTKGNDCIHWVSNNWFGGGIDMNHNSMTRNYNLHKQSVRRNTINHTNGKDCYCEEH